jgi:hypothetical protein
MTGCEFSISVLDAQNAKGLALFKFDGINRIAAIEIKEPVQIH